MRLITLTTDFGRADWFAGTMEGVIAGIAPKTRVVHLTHEIPPGDIRAGAFALAASCRFFPRGTVHVAVVDPGVGSVRRAIAVETARYVFVGPDNGVLSWALAKERVKGVRMLENEDLFLPQVSRTFHGRDVFAPVAAHLSRGVAFRKLGRALDEFVRIAWPEPRVRAGGISGEVIYIDRFGNAITNIASDLIGGGEADLGARVFLKRRVLGPLVAFYQAIPPGRAAAVPGSTGLLEIALNGASAAQRLHVQIGDPVMVRARNPRSANLTFHALK